jgi:hypothetical protein
VFEVLRDHIREIEVLLGTAAGVDPVTDRMHVGRIDGLKAVLNLSFEEMN